MEEVGKILPRVLRKQVRGERPPVLEVLAGLWPNVAGKSMAEQARPVAFRDGILTLVTASESWAIQLRGLREEIRAAANRALGRPLVKQLRVRLTLDPGFEPSPDSQNTESRSAPACLEEDARASAGLPLDLDPEIRAILARSFGKYFGRNATGKIN